MSLRCSCLVLSPEYETVEYILVVCISVGYSFPSLSYMRFHAFLALTAGLVERADAADGCTGSEILSVTTNWYKDLVYCAIAQNGAFADRDALHTCLDGLSVIDNAGVVPVEDADLVTLTSEDGTCATCMLTFANAVYALKSGMEAGCEYELGADDSLALINTSACLSYLYTPITAVNDCMKNDDTFDLVTGTTSQRCTTAQFTAIDGLYRTWGDIVDEATATTPEANLVDVEDSNLATDVAAAVCEPCFETLYDAAKLLDEECEGAAYSDACLEASADAREAFAVCTGGHSLDVDTSLCAAYDDDWYKDIIYCANARSSDADFTLADLNTCVAALGTATATAPAKSASLKSALGGGTREAPCNTCMLDFANAAFARMADFATACSYETVDTDAIALYSESVCLAMMYDEINAVNECISADGAHDLVTGTDSKRCTTAQFVEIDRLYRPWGDLAAVANAASPAASLTISTAFDDAIAEVGCASCFEDLYDAVKGEDSCEDGLVYSDACLAATTVAREDFGVCTGGHIMNVEEPTQCTAKQWMLFDTVYRPFVAYVACNEEWIDAEDTEDFDACVSDYTGLEESPATDCDVCYETFVSEIETVGPAGCTTATDDECVAELYEVRGPLYNFAVCSGYEMDTAATQCTTDEEAALSADFKSFVPLYIAAKHAANQYTAGELIDVLPAFEEMPAAIDGITCASCFRAFTADAYYQFTNDSAIESLCVNPYSADCEEALSVILNRFDECSGITFTNDATITCSDDEYAALANGGINNAVLSLALSSEHVTAMLSQLDTILAGAVADDLTAPCWTCYVELSLAIFELSDADKVTCANLLGSGCLLVLSEAVSAFETCSGSAFAGSVDVETTTTTTSEVATTTTETPTTTAATTTTTKSAFIPSLAAAAAVLIFTAL